MKRKPESLNEVPFAPGHAIEDHRGRFADVLRVTYSLNWLIERPEMNPCRDAMHVFDFGQLDNGGRIIATVEEGTSWGEPHKRVHFSYSSSHRFGTAVIQSAIWRLTGVNPTRLEWSDWLSGKVSVSVWYQFDEFLRAFNEAHVAGGVQ